MLNLIIKVVARLISTHSHPYTNTVVKQRDKGLPCRMITKIWQRDLFCLRAMLARQRYSTLTLLHLFCMSSTQSWSSCQTLNCIVGYVDCPLPPYRQSFWKYSNQCWGSMTFLCRSGSDFFLITYSQAHHLQS